MRYREDEYDVNWGALESGMLDIAAELEACVADGLHSIVVEPIIAFYQRFHWCCENCLIDQYYNFCMVHDECDHLLTAWIEHPTTDDGAKRELLCKLQQICRLSTYSEQGLYGVPELTMKPSSMLQTPEETLAHIDRLLEKEPDSTSLLQKKIELLRKMGQEKQASACIRQKLHVHCILEDELRRLCAAGEPGAARKLVEAAIRRSIFPNSHLLKRRKTFLAPTRSSPLGSKPAHTYTHHLPSPQSDARRTARTMKHIARAAKLSPAYDHIQHSLHLHPCCRIRKG